MKILILNCGSSSAKYQVYDWNNKSVLASGMVERVGTSDAFIDHSGSQEATIQKACPSHTEAIELILSCLQDPKIGVLSNLSEISVIGNRIVHGGERFTKSVKLTEDVIKELEAISNLAPLHNPAHLLGIRAAQKVLPNVPQMAIFDTSWHQSMPKSSYLYALPYEWYQKNSIRRYGFHGTSYLYITKRASVLLKKNSQETNLIIAHIGNGSSMNAVKQGKSFDTSMGFTPLEGLIMGTRSGDFDPAIMSYMQQELKVSSQEMDNFINKKSGLLGITQKYVDRRDVEKGSKEGDEQCKLAIEMECYRLRKYIGSYFAALEGKVDALIFTAGVGEMSPLIREGALKGLESLGFDLDYEKNAIARVRNAEVCISKSTSKIKIFIIPTDEELVMVEDCVALLENRDLLSKDFSYSFEDSQYTNKQRANKWLKQIEKNTKLAQLEVKI